MIYLAIYLAIGIVFAGVFGPEEGRLGGVITGFVWPLFALWWLIMFAFNLGR